MYFEFKFEIYTGGIEMEEFYSYSELPAIMTVPELASFLGIGRCAAYDLARSDQLDVLRIGHQIRIPRHSVLRYLGVPDPVLTA